MHPAFAAILLLAQLQRLPPQLIALDSAEGQALLFNATARAAYFPLAAQFTTQRSTAFCGVASAVMVLNAMPIAAPVAPEYAPFRAFTQDNVFGPQSPVTAEHVAKGGLTLEHLEALLRANGADVDSWHTNDPSPGTLDLFRARASASLSTPGHHVLVDFDRSELGQDLGAHWSPLAAYDAKSDRFLVLDVARFRYPPYWATAADLFRAMSTFDRDAGQQRGYLLISPHAGAPARIEVAPLRHRIYLYGIAAIALLLLLGGGIGFVIGRRTRKD
jgi:hypothetical protein